MKTPKEIFKANGRTFNTYEEVESYARKNNYRITNKDTVNYVTKRLKMKVNYIDLTSLK